MSNLERRYRRLLGVLPRWYRRDREEEMVGIFLAERTDDLDLEHSWPGWAETWATLGLAVRTHLAAGAALTQVPDGARWRGEVVRALGMLGLLLGVFYTGASITSAVVMSGTVHLGPTVPWLRALELLPVVAFVMLLTGRRTSAKVAAGLALLPAVVRLGMDEQVLVWVVFQLPVLVTFAALCLGFHREAPTPPARRLVWWGGGALVLGAVGGVATGAGLLAVVVVVTVLRVFAYVRGDVVFGRALSVLAVLLLGSVVLLFVGTELYLPGLLLGVVLVLDAVLPVRRRRRTAGLGVS